MRITSRRLATALAGILLIALLPAVGLAQPAPPPGLTSARLERLRSVPVNAAPAAGGRQAQATTGDESDLLGRIERFRCHTEGNPQASVDMSCNTSTLLQDVSPDNEITVAVDPADPDHLLAGSNDYFLRFLPNGDQLSTVPAGFFTSFDGGKHWLDGQIPFGRGNSASDPSAAFDARHHVALMASLDYTQPPEGGETSDGNAVVSRSTDGGRTWREPVVALEGHGADSDPDQVFWDKEWLTVDNYPHSPYYGRAYLTATRFLGGFAYQESPIWLTWSDDGGRTWSAPREVSGSHPSCTFQTTDPANECDESQFSVPEVAPDGTVYVNFTNFQHEAAWEIAFDSDSQLMVTRSTNGGRVFSAPVPVAQLEDGFSDMPFNILGAITIWGHQFRLGQPGNMSVSPTNGQVVVVYEDRGEPNPNASEECVALIFEQGPQPPDYDPCNAGPGSQTDIYKVTSNDRGGHWSTPTLVDGAPGSQWFPWADHAPDGSLAVAWDEDTQASPADTFHHVLRTRSGRQVLTPPAGRARAEHPDVAATHWVGQYLDDPAEWPRICGPSGYSDPPVRDARGKDCSVFIGDYTGLAVGSDGSVNVVWTGLNRFVTSPQIDQHTGGRHDGFAADAMFARR